MTISDKQQEFYPECRSFVCRLMDGFEIEIDFADFRFEWAESVFNFLRFARNQNPNKEYKFHLKLLNTQLMTDAQIGRLETLDLPFELKQVTSVYVNPETQAIEECVQKVEN